MYYVKVEGKTLADLKHGLERHLAELGGYTDKSSVSVKVKELAIVPTQTVDNQEYEEVESPFANVAPTLNVPAARPMVVDNELDAEGIPWDSRIHSSSRAKVKNGTWRIARGVSDEAAFPIKQELKARVGGAVVQTAPVVVTPAVQAAPVTYVAPVAQAPVTVVQTPIMPQMNNGGHTLATFQANFPLIIAQLITEGKLTQQYINELNAYFQITEIHKATPEQQALCFETFVQAGTIQKVG